MTRGKNAAKRRMMVGNLYSEGITIAEIARSVAAPVGTVSCDLTILRRTGDSRVAYRRPSAAATAFGIKTKPFADLPTLQTASIDDIRASVLDYETRLLEELGRVRHLRDALSTSHNN